MRTHSRIIALTLLAGSMSLGITADAASAQKLRQPASVLPWSPAKRVPPQAEELPTLKAPSNVPAWLIETDTELPASSHAEELPFVETEHASNLGTLDAHPKTLPYHAQRRGWSTQSSDNSSFSLLRALGFQAARSGDRR